MIRQLGFKLLLLTIAGTLGSVHPARAQLTGGITVEVNELRNREGNVCLKLFDSSEGFPNGDESALQIVCVPIEDSTVADPTSNPSDSVDSSVEITPSSEPPAEAVSPTESNRAEPTTTPLPESDDLTDSTFRYTFDNLPYGNYAVAIYHDRNSNERLNRGLFGMPTEGYGFSNDAPANFGPADFDDAVFAIESTDVRIPIRMRYP